MESIKFAEKLPTNFVNFYNVIPYPGTELYEWIEKNEAWIYHPDYVVKNIGSRDLKPVFETPQFREGERRDVLKKGFALYDKTILRFRFGKIVGGLLYILSRNKSLYTKGIRFALGNRLGFKIYSLVTHRSR